MADLQRNTKKEYCKAVKQTAEEIGRHLIDVDSDRSRIVLSMAEGHVNVERFLHVWFSL